MTGAFEALRMNNDFRRAIEKTVCGERLKPRSKLRLDACTGSYNADAERWGHSAFASLPMSGVSRHNRQA
jgi:hypothetical protein